MGSSNKPNIALSLHDRSTAYDCAFAKDALTFPLQAVYKMTTALSMSVIATPEQSRFHKTVQIGIRGKDASR